MYLRNGGEQAQMMEVFFLLIWFPEEVDNKY